MWRRHSVATKSRLFQVAGFEIVLADDLILTTTQLITVWPAAADGRLFGEDIYFGHNPFRNAERISAADLPDYYQAPRTHVG